MVIFHRGDKTTETSCVVLFVQNAECSASLVIVVCFFSLKPNPDPNEEAHGPRSLAADNGFGSPLGIRNKVRRFGCPAGHLAEGTRFETNAPNLI